jgi:hypothetical protein
MPAPATLMNRLTKDSVGGRGLFQLNLQIERQNIFGFVGPTAPGRPPPSGL